jgi:PAS domain-containing protein
MSRREKPPIVYEGLPAAQVVIRDITERKRIEEELRDIEERLRTVIHNVPAVLFVMDREGVFKLSEGKGLEGIGLESGDIVGQVDLRGVPRRAGDPGITPGGHSRAKSLARP